MASKEGSGSPFPWQPPAPTAKLRIYESLFLLNQGVDRVIALLRSMQKLPFADKTSVECAIAEIEEVRCDMNADFAEHLADSERFDEGRFWKQRRAFEKKWRDPEDVYIDVLRREDERKKQRLPPRLGVLPDAPKERRGRKSNQARPARRSGKCGK